MFRWWVFSLFIGYCLGRLDVDISIILTILSWDYGVYHGGGIMRNFNWGLLMMRSQIMALGILTIWARGMGPRFRPDQLSDLTWKDLALLAGGLVLVALGGIYL